MWLIVPSFSRVPDSQGSLMEPGIGKWTTIGARTVRGSWHDEIGTVAAGVAFFTLLAIFPGIAAVVSLVGLFADPARVQELLNTASDLLPPGTAQIIARQVRRLGDAASAAENRRALSLTPYIGFAILLWSMNKATKALFRAMNAIHGLEETRGFLVFTVATLAFTLGTVVFLVFAVGIGIVLPMALAETRAIDLLRWPVLLLVVAAVLAIIYRYGPSRARHRGAWPAIAVGSAFAAVLWLGGSMLFSWYVSAFGGFVELYGSLAAVMGLLIWIWLSLIAVLVGAEIEAAIVGCGGMGFAGGGTTDVRRPAAEGHQT